MSAFTFESTFMHIRSKRTTLILCLLIAFSMLLSACVTLQVRIERTPTPDYEAIGTLAALMLTGTHYAARATELAIPITPTPSTGLVSGMICYPSDRIPAMTAIFRNPDTGAIIELEVEENQDFYRLRLAPGRYYAMAWVSSYRVGGMYTYAVPCGLDEACGDHTPMAFELNAGDNLERIDLCDWVFPPEDLPLPPGYLATGNRKID